MANYLNALAGAQSAIQGDIRANRLLDLQRRRMGIEEAETQRMNDLARAAGAQFAADDLTGARNTLAMGGNLKDALALQGEIGTREKAAQEAQNAAGERLATFGAQILSLPQEQQQGAYMAVLPQIHETLRAANIQFDPNDRTFDDSDREVMRGLAARFGKLPGGLEPTTTARNLEAAGLRPGTPEFQEAMLKAVTKPQVQVNTGKLPPGFIPNDPADLSKGIKPIPGGPQDPRSQSRKRSATEASNISSARSAIGEVNDIKSVLFSATGELNRGELLEGIKIPLLGIEGVPFTSGRGVRQKMKRAIEVALRARTGAAAPESEVQNYMQMFFPSPLDRDEDALRKVDALQEFLGGILTELDAGDMLQEPSQDDLEFTAKKHGITVEEVKRRLKNAP